LNVERLGAQGKPFAPLDPLYLSIALWKARNQASVFYSPGYNSPLFTLMPFVFTVHDLNHIDVKGSGSFLKSLYYDFVLKRGCQKAAYVLTVSEFSRNRIIDWAGVDPAKVVNVSEGVDPAYDPSVIPYSPGYPYFLIVSNRKRHKNEDGIVAAFAKANLPSELRMVFTGRATPALTDMLNRYGLAARCVFMGSVPDSEMASLYRGATALVFPSFYEGFGLPVLEAMACGTPVITSNRTSLPEIAGDAALLVEPDSVDEIADAMSRITQDEALRYELSRRGLARARDFSWDKTAARVEAILQSVEATVRT